MAEEKSSPVAILCVTCGTMLGHFVVIEDVEFLQVGGILAREIHGACAQCGKELHWNVQDRRFELLLKRVLRAEHSSK